MLRRYRIPESGLLHLFERWGNSRARLGMRHQGGPFSSGYGSSVVLGGKKAMFWVGQGGHRVPKKGHSALNWRSAAPLPRQPASGRPYFFPVGTSCLSSSNQF